MAIWWHDVNVDISREMCTGIQSNLGTGVANFECGQGRVIWALISYVDRVATYTVFFLHYIVTLKWQIMVRYDRGTSGPCFTHCVFVRLMTSQLITQRLTWCYDCGASKWNVKSNVNRYRFYYWPYTRAVVYLFHISLDKSSTTTVYDIGPWYFH